MAKSKKRENAEPAKRVLDQARRSADETGDLALKALAEAVAQRKPFAVRDLKAAIAKVDDEVAALVNRRAIVDRMVQDVLAGRGERISAALTEGIAAGEKRAAMLGKLLRQAEKAVPLPDDGRPVEQADKPASRDIVALLEELGRKHPGDGISHEQAAAARQIAQINEAISAAGQVRAVNCEGAGGGVGRPFRDIVIAGKLDEIRSRKYLPWCAAMNATADGRVMLAIVIGVSVYNLSVKLLERKHRLRHGSAVIRLREGLDAFIGQARVSAPSKAMTVAQLDS